MNLYNAVDETRPNFTIVKWVFINVSMEIVDDDVNIVLIVQNAWKN